MDRFSDDFIVENRFLYWVCLVLRFCENRKTKQTHYKNRSLVHGHPIFKNFNCCAHRFFVKNYLYGPIFRRFYSWESVFILSLFGFAIFRKIAKPNKLIKKTYLWFRVTPFSKILIVARNRFFVKNYLYGPIFSRFYSWESFFILSLFGFAIFRKSQNQTKSLKKPISGSGLPHFQKI